ncbi:MAG: exodeoxyribonuclease VII large subunit, partial [Proteobacteria bacterium]|nr:exodeoxyribonuclease VII large subunit [Pseudomonadota bacterium]
MNNTLGKSAQSPLSPSQLNRVVRTYLETDFPAMWISGEIAETYTSVAGHSYFTLKDESSSVKCVLFKNFNIHSGKIKIGDKTTILGNLTLYLSRGEFQINVRRIMQAGTGTLELQFLKLKQKLESMGLFDKSRKKNIPEIINSLAIITSKKGAAIKDILNVLKSHNPLITVTIYNSLVQGEKATE